MFPRINGLSRRPPVGPTLAEENAIVGVSVFVQALYSADLVDFHAARKPGA